MFSFVQSALVFIIAIFAMAYVGATTGLLGGTKTEIEESYGALTVVSLVEVVTSILYLSLYKIDEMVIHVMMITWVFFWTICSAVNLKAWRLSPKKTD